MISACVFGLLLPQSPDVELSPASSCDHEKLYHTNGDEVDSHLQQVGRKYFCDYIPPKIAYWARLQSSQDHFIDPINLVSDSSGDSPPTIKKRRVMQRDVTIAVTNEFLASPSRFGRNVRHVDTSGKPQFTAIEERVIGINESKAVYQRFEESGGFDKVPIAFLGCAQKLISEYQRAIARKASWRAILCSRGDSSGPLPPKIKPEIVRSEYVQITYNWFLAEYKTFALYRWSTSSLRRKEGLKRKMKRLKHQAQQEDQEDSGSMSSHSVDFGAL